MKFSIPEIIINYDYPFKIPLSLRLYCEFRDLSHRVMVTINKPYLSYGPKEVIELAELPVLALPTMP